MDKSNDNPGPSPYQPVMENHDSLNPEKSNVSKAAGIVGFYTFLSRIMGLVRDMVVARVFGAGLVADAFFVAFRIPNLLRRLFAEGSLTIAFIPVFTEYLRIRSRKDAIELARIILTMLSILLVFITILGILCAPWIVRALAYGFGGSGEKYEITVLLTRIMFPYILLISLVALFMGILNSLRKFTAPAAAPILLNVGMISGAFFISPHLSQPIIGLALGVIIGGILQVCLQIPWVLASGISLCPRWIPNHPAVKRIGLLMLPAIFGSAIYQFNQFIGILLASLLQQGSISWLYYADRLVQFPLGIFAISISTAALPSLSRQVADKNLKEFNETLTHSLNLTFFIIIPSMAGLIVLGRPIIELLFEGGVFDHNSTLMTAKALIFYSVGLWAFAGTRVAVSGFYAFQDTKTPVRIAIVAMASNLIFSLILMRFLGHGGLALALSFSSSIHFCMLIGFLKMRMGQWKIYPLLIYFVKCMVGSIIMGIAVYFLYFRVFKCDLCPGMLNMISALFCTIIIGMIIYFVITRVLGCRELQFLIDMFRSLAKKR